MDFVVDENESAAASEGGETTLSGQFTVRYFGSRGSESFEIQEVEGGWMIDCTLDPPTEGLLPSETRYRLGPDRRFISAKYEETGPGGVDVVYQLQEGKLVARGTDSDGKPLPELAVEVDSRGIVSGPNYATDFYVLYPLDLAVGETVSVDAAVFGFRSWRPEPLRLTTTRKKNRKVMGAGSRRVECLVYRSKLELDDSTTWATSYLDPETGEVHRLTIDLMIGSAKIIRE